MTTLPTRHVLVVDDEADIREYLSMALEDAGFRVTTASDGFEAMRACREDPPDMISLDLVMPGQSGAKFYHELQRDRELKHIPVMVVTGHARDELGKVDFESLTMSGVGVYLEKPVTPPKYIDAVCRVLGLESPPAE